MKPLYEPLPYLLRQIEETLDEVKEYDFKDDRRYPEPAVANIRPKRNDLVKLMYQNDLVRVNKLSYRLADKLFFYRTFKSSAPEVTEKYLAKTYGVKDFLLRHQLVDPEKKKIIVKKKVLRELLNDIFPGGFLLKPTTGFNSNGVGFIFKEKDIVETLSGNLDQLLKEDHFDRPFYCPFLETIASGEQYLIQEKFSPVGKKAKIDNRWEYRVHTLENRVVEGGTFQRWDKHWDENELFIINALVQNFLNQLPPFLTLRQGWSFDVMRLGEREIKIIEVNTNRGAPRHWSGDMQLPETLAGYTRHLEDFYNLYVDGKAGRILKSGKADWEKFIKKNGEKVAAKHVKLRENRVLLDPIRVAPYQAFLSKEIPAPRFFQ